MRLRSVSMLLLVGFGVAMLGCAPAGPKRNPVSGTVRYKNQPIKAGLISFRSEDDKHVGTGTITDGRYDIPKESGLPAAKYVVAISYPDPKVPAPKGDEPPGESLPVHELLPAKYNERTELKTDIKEGPNDVNYDLK